MVWTIIGSIGSLVGGIGSLIAVVIAIYVYIETSKEDRKVQKTNAELERVRATLRDFPSMRRNNVGFEQHLASLSEKDRENFLISTLGQIEQFAVGINIGAYSLDIVNRMSGGMLIHQYEKHFKSFIERRRTKGHPEIPAEKLYCEYEEMIKKLYEKRKPMQEDWVDKNYNPNA